jgi:hypothetical protein
VKTSEAINRLQDIIKTHGDIEIKFNVEGFFTNKDSPFILRRVETGDNYIGLSYPVNCTNDSEVKGE